MAPYVELRIRVVERQRVALVTAAKGEGLSVAGYIMALYEQVPHLTHRIQMLEQRLDALEVEPRQRRLLP